MDKHIAVVLSAGSGRRMHTEVAKQYLEIRGLPLICYTIQAFEDSKVDGIILVVGPGDVHKVQKEIVDHYGYKKVIKIVEGGAMRSASVYAGLCACEEFSNPTGELYVHIHDGARCLITPGLIDEMIMSVRARDAVSLAIPVKDTIRRGTESGWFDKSMDRADLYVMQTPQSFEYNMIKRSFEAMRDDPTRSEMTDDVMVLEVYGHKKTFLIPGSPENIKITNPEDLYMLEALLQKREAKEKEKAESKNKPWMSALEKYAKKPIAEGGKSTEENEKPESDSKKDETDSKKDNTVSKKDASDEKSPEDKDKVDNKKPK